VDSADTVEAQAARWLARREARPPSPEEERAFETWCGGDPRRLGAYVRLEAVSARMDRATALSGADLRVRPRAPRAAWTAAAAVAAAAAVVVVVWPGGPLLQRPIESRSLATDVGEQRRTLLPDGSLLELNTATRAAVTLKRDEREVRLTAGEAVFEVAKDKNRPFIVKTALGDVRAVGTVFSVRVDRDLQVGVSEGIVEIERGGKVVARIAAGETFELASNGEAVRKGGQTEAITRAMAWREGKVAFAGETLAEAASELNRYNTVKIRIDDPDVARLRFGAWFRATDPEGFAAALAESLPVTATRDGDEIVLSARR